MRATTANRTVLMALGAYDPRTHEGIAEASRELGWFLDISLLKTLEIPPRWAGDGILTSLNQNRRLERLVRNSGLPVVDLSVWRSDLAFPRVVADNPGIGRLAARHFREYGHTAFAWFARRMNPVWEERLAGYREEVEGFDRTPEVLVARGRWRSGEIPARLHALPKPTAVFCPSDEEAAFLIANCVRSGISIPGEIAILGVDNNTLICENQPTPLSSVNHDLHAIGYQGARLLGRILNGETVPTDPAMRIPPHGITVQASTDALAVSDPVVRRGLELMRSHPGDRIGVGGLASRLNVGRRDFERRFRAATGVTPHQRWREFRLEAARRRIEAGIESMEDISAVCGFSNGPHLSNCFRERFGVSPMQWRRQFSSDSRLP